MDRKKLLVLAAVAVVVALFFTLDLGRYLDLEFLQAQRGRMHDLFLARPLLVGAVFFAIYVAVTGLSLPGAAVLTLVAGAIFGLGWGTVIVSFASTLGATCAFLLARYLARDTVRRRFAGALERIDGGVRKDGAFYLFTLRLVPVFPFFIINLAMGLTSMRVLAFAFVSQAGMLPGTLVYVNAGTRLGELESLAGILSPAILLSFALLGVFPLVAKKIVDALRARRIYRGYRRPKRFERDLVVIGAGSAGLVSSLIGATVRARVTLVEKDEMGGDCLNTGCVPSKSLIRTAKFLSHVARAEELGVRGATADFDFAQVMDRVHRNIERIAPHDSVERYEGLGVDCVRGEAFIESPFAVRVGERTITTRNIVVATGAAPVVPPIPGIEDVAPLTSETVWGLRPLPSRLVVVGGGPIGCELAQCFARFGSEVSQIQTHARVLPREDPEFSELVAERLRGEGVDLLTEHRASAFTRDGGRKTITCTAADDEVREIEFDEVILAVGRAPRTAGFGLEELGIETARGGGVETDDFLATRFPNIYACGDVAGPYQFTHTASHQAWYASVNALFGGLKRFRADYSVVPWATFTDPEVARVGLNEIEATEQGIPFEVTRYGFDDLDRAIADSEAHGLVKVLTVPGKDRILGATIAGEHAGDLLMEFVLAMRHGLGLKKLLGTIHVYPTMAEGAKFAAGNWRREHAPERVLRWLERYHRWRRGGS
ncbi:MAG: FAD-dependent oxidoreductase [Immundisolibacterales bacterium]|nr:FAD-dependent oxidoreductase [Immundisolibacterales bacterium]